MLRKQVSYDKFHCLLTVIKEGWDKTAFPVLLQDKTLSEQIFDNWIILYQITIMKKNP